MFASLQRWHSPTSFITKPQMAQVQSGADASSTGAVISTKRLPQLRRLPEINGTSLGCNPHPRLVQSVALDEFLVIVAQVVEQYDPHPVLREPTCKFGETLLA